MRRIARIVLLSMVAALAAVGLDACARDGDTVYCVEPAPHQVHVQGQGTAVALPDMAQVQFGVQTAAATVAEALAANEERMEAVLAALAAQGVAAADLRTSQFAVVPQRDYSTEPRVGQIVGYWVSNYVAATLRDLTALGAILQAAIDAGANDVSGLTFTLADFAPLRAEARAAAVADAAGRAATLAEAAGARLGEVIRLDEVSVGGVSLRRADAENAGTGASVPVAPGNLEVTVCVDAIFALE